MPVANADLSLKRAENNSDLASNGGYLAAGMLVIPSSLFPNVNGSECALGITRYRKVFFHNSQSDGASAITKYTNLGLDAPMLYIENISPASDHFTAHIGDMDDVQSEAIGYTGWAGVGYLEANIASGVFTLGVRCEVVGSAGELFQNSGLVVLSKFQGGVLTREFVTLANPGVSWNSTLGTLTIVSATQLGWNRAYDTRVSDAGNTGTNYVGHASAAYSINSLVNKRVRIKSGSGIGQVRRIVSNTVTRIIVESAWTVALVAGSSEYEILDTMVSMCVPLPASLLASYSNVVVTSTAGTFTHTGNVKTYPAGTLDDTWTILFSGPTTFTVSGTHYTGIALPAGVVSADYTPANGSSYLFKIPITAWGGLFQAGDTVVFQTRSSSGAVWIKEVVAAGSPVHSANSIDLGTFGDTV